MIQNTTWYRVLWMLLLLILVTSMTAQPYVQKHKHGDWFAGVSGGVTQSLAENAKSTDFLAHPLPTLGVSLGHNFNPYFGLRLSGYYGKQLSRCSNEALNAKPGVYGTGRYTFKCLTGSLSALVNVTNIFFGYNVDRGTSWNVIVGAGYLNTSGFDEKLEAWNKYSYYPVNTSGGNYVVATVGVQCAVRLNEPLDFNFELNLNSTSNAYDGVSNGNRLDFYLEMKVGLSYHFKNGKQGLRRFRQPKGEVYVDPVLKEDTSVQNETVRYGEYMYTVIPFYSGFYYLNTTTSRRLERVAKFLRSHPLVNVNIVGHPDIEPEEDAEYHHRLAQKRAEAVREALITRFQINPLRLRTTAGEHPLQSYKIVREWVPAVNFIMEDPGDDESRFAEPQ